MCETRDLGIKWPHWHALIFFAGEVRIDMRYVCPKDVKKMLVQQAWSVYWKKWCSNARTRIIEGILLEPALTLLRKNRQEDWTEKHGNVARKPVLEGGWVQKKLFDVGWLD